MLQRTHEELTRAVILECDALPSSSLIDDVSRYSSFPDRVGNVEIAGFGTRVYGMNACSLTHFAGYEWKKDPSLPHLELPDRTVSCDWAAWSRGAPFTVPGAYGDPLRAHLDGLRAREFGGALLLPGKELVGGWLHGRRELEGTAATQGKELAADEMRWPSGASYAAWFDSIVLDWVRHSPLVPLGMFRAAVGCGLHFVQDFCVPHHRRNALLNGHSRFEGAMDDRFRALLASGEAGKIVQRELSSLRNGPRRWPHVPMRFADACADLLQRRTPAVRCWTWNATVRSSVEDALVYTTRAAAFLLGCG